MPRPAMVTDVMEMTREQARYFLSRRRFNVVPAGRRSGKTAIAKRRLVKKARLWYGIPEARFIASAPVQHQAKRIYWNDIKRLIPKHERRHVSESELTIELLNGAIVQVMGMDKPERAEGSPIAHFLFDEYANCKEEAWVENIMPALSETEGSADFIGVPEGRNHYWKLYRDALVDTTGQWDAFTWKTVDVLPIYLGYEKAMREIAYAMANMDDLTYRQEYEADFNNFEGRIYYPFQRNTHARERVRYQKDRPLILCFDFNVSPGVCVYAQDQLYKGKDPLVGENGEITSVIGEVYIPKNSNTPTVCRKVISDLHPESGEFAKHKGEVHIYGDATGGIKKTQSVDGSDWDIVRDYLRPVFGERLKMRTKKENPPERVRVNAVNTRLQTADGRRRMLFDPINAPRTIEDMEAVCAIEGTNGEIDKDTNPDLTHLSDALGYFTEIKHPMRSVNRMEIGSAD